jgi:hypothetical protein
LRILNIAAPPPMVMPMKNALALSALLLTLFAGFPAAAGECYADYKAKRDAPLQLHYGVMQLNDSCTKAAARSEVATRLRRSGWTLLNVLSVFDESGLSERKASAGKFYLRF